MLIISAPRRKKGCGESPTIGVLLAQGSSVNEKTERQGVEAAYHRQRFTAVQQLGYASRAVMQCLNCQFANPEGLATVAEALDWAQSNGGSYYEAELYRLKGELLLQRAAKEAKEES